MTHNDKTLQAGPVSTPITHLWNEQPIGPEDTLYSVSGLLSSTLPDGVSIKPVVGDTHFYTVFVWSQIQDTARLLCGYNVVRAYHEGSLCALSVPVGAMVRFDAVFYRVEAQGRLVACQGEAAVREFYRIPSGYTRFDDGNGLTFYLAPGDLPILVEPGLWLLKGGFTRVEEYVYYQNYDKGSYLLSAKPLRHIHRANELTTAPERGQEEFLSLYDSIHYQARYAAYLYLLRYGDTIFTDDHAYSFSTDNEQLLVSLADAAYIEAQQEEADQDVMREIELRVRMSGGTLLSHGLNILVSPNVSAIRTRDGNDWYHLYRGRLFNDVQLSDGTWLQRLEFWSNKPDVILMVARSVQVMTYPEVAPLGSQYARVYVIPPGTVFRIGDEMFTPETV